MKTKLLLLALIAFAMRVSAQTGNLIVFTEGGEKFSLVLNGVLQNASPETNVKVTDLPASPDYPTGYKMKIIFADAALGTKDFNTAVQNGIERTVTIKKNNKGEYVQRPISDVPLAQAPPTPSTQIVHVYSTTPPAATTTSTTVSRSTTTTTNSTQPTGENVNISMGVNTNENGGGMNVNVSGMDNGMSSGTTTTTTTHTTTTTSGNIYQTPPPPAPRPDYSGPVGCPVAMSQNDFQRLKSTIDSKSFEDSKLTIAKQVLNNNCLMTSQVKDIMLLFSFEATRLDFAKYAYGYTYDIGNYYLVNDAFTFESSINDLNTYISSYRR